MSDEPRYGPSLLQLAATPAGRLQMVHDLLNPMVYDEATDTYVPGEPVITPDQALQLLADGLPGVTPR